MQGPKAIRVVTMSDTHDLHFKVDFEKLPPGDIFIHAGDFTKISTQPQLLRFREFLGLLPYKHKVVIAGNHDFALDTLSYQKSLKKKKHTVYGGKEVDTASQIKKLKECCTYLEHQAVEIEGLTIFGSPYTPQFCEWGFMYKEGEADQLWSAIPDNVDVLVTHGPPYGILDLNLAKQHTGCKSLLKKVMQVRPKLHVFGHIHESYGLAEEQGIIFHNASATNIAYKLVNKCRVFEIEPKK